eukprot:NODE_47_length_32105_cov_1.240892.p22 type:complete len:187 gc:universal NODE_47_length_32105_cov_1.240892:23242-23802(+)
MTENPARYDINSTTYLSIKIIICTITYYSISLSNQGIIEANFYIDGTLFRCLYYILIAILAMIFIRDGGLKSQIVFMSFLACSNFIYLILTLYVYFTWYLNSDAAFKSIYAAELSIWILTSFYLGLGFYYIRQIEIQKNAISPSQSPTHQIPLNMIALSESLINKGYSIDMIQSKMMEWKNEIDVN